MIPCELVVRKLLPGIRSAVAKKLKEEGKSQREIAHCLGITEAAVSQYFSRKRAHLNPKSIEVKISESFGKFRLKGKTVDEITCDICKDLRSKKVLCVLHNKKYSGKIADCRVCISAC